MAEPPPESSYTPPRTPLSDSTRLQGGSMEDHDSPVIRKRPRLDSGSGSGVAPLSLQNSAAPASNMDLTPDARPAGKMTINVKSPTLDMPSESADPAPADPATPPPAPAHPHATHDNVISISSSPSPSPPPESPKIEVAVLEDMDQDPHTSNWQSLEEAMRDKDQDHAVPEILQVHHAVSLVDRFPRVSGNISAQESLNRICLMIETYDSRDIAALTLVKPWIDECADSLEHITAELLAEDFEFWECLPSLFEMILRRNQTILLENGHDTWADTLELFLNYIRIAVRMIQLDTMIMRHLVNEPDLQPSESLCQRYLNTLNWIFHCANIPYFRSLEKLDEDQAHHLMNQIRVQSVAAPINAHEALADLTDAILPLTPRFRHVANLTCLILSISTNLADGPVDRELEFIETSRIDSPSDPPFVRTIYHTIRAIDENYQKSITKKSPWVSSELSETLLRSLLRGYNLICQRYPHFEQLLARDLSLELPHVVDPDQSVPLITWAWKFGVLKRLIMEGRMELRVQGVETMQSDLVNVWRQTIAPSSNALALPFVQYLIRFIKDHKIVDYLVGVDSHLQLIGRSSNIVGFLIVTSTYTDAETDVIWKTVTESQDRRIVSEVLNMLVRTFFMHTTAAPALLYTCQKVLELPLIRFDGRMIDFCDNLLSRLCEKPSDHSGADHVDSTPLRLCVRLMRDSTAAEDLPVEQKTQLQDFGSRQLEKFLKAGISDSDRTEMYERCISDIAQMNQFAAGSIQVLSALVPAHDSQEMWKLATDFDLTRLVINDLLHTVNGLQVDFTELFSKHGLISRLKILFRLVDMAPDTITPELSSALWNGVLSSNNLGAEGQTAVWAMMVDALTQSGKPNSFLERCISDYLPALRPNQFSLESLAFAKNAVGYEVRFNPPHPAGENEVVSIPGMDRIWSFILTAPPGSIEGEAAKFAIETYLDHPIIKKSPRSAVEATHIAIVDRCVDQLKSAAAALKSQDDVSSSDVMETETMSGSLQANELEFRRSLLFLRSFLNGLRTRPQYSPPQGPSPRLPEQPSKGELVEITWQSFGAGKNSGINTLTIGDLSTATELVERLTQLTGFSKFTTIWKGHRTDLLENPEALVRDIRYPGLLIVRAAPDAQAVGRDCKRQPLTSVDCEVLKHFDEIYDLLALKDRLAREIYDFLAVFPPQERVLALVKSEANSQKDVFPLQKPFVALHSFSVLQICLEDEAVESSPKQRLVSHSIEILVGFLMSEEILQSLAEDFLKLSLTVGALECLLTALVAYRPVNESSVLIDNPAPFAKRLLDLIEHARLAVPKAGLALVIHKVICNSFALLIEGSIRNAEFWDAVKQQTKFERLFESLLLQDTRQTLRNEVSERTKMVCTPSKSTKQPTRALEGPEIIPPAESAHRIDMLATIWNALVQIIPGTPDHASQSAEFFKVALWIFQSVTERSPKDVMFSHYLQEWSLVMFRHHTQEFVGREPIDHLILGFASLLELCLQLADDAKVELETSDVARQIISIYLFPDLSPDVEEGAALKIVPRVPVMHSETRKKLYNIVNLLCKGDQDNLSQAITSLEDVIPRDYSYGPNWSWDRSKMIRTQEGYAGLKNLSNTCYLNSLMTQLFMNVEFRDFMLSLRLVDPESSQNLLFETQRLFAWMQDTWMKSYDPLVFVESIRTYDNEPIDVTVQMDVDEFYNLLFDRWEAQVIDPEDKQRFRTFYGGQLVQQIKSKECSHISERLEPFSAIQCDIKGKASLSESLQAYVEGEIMQGDNKYSCTGCGRHVDAVKRACLKDVPDNLIFHLKRFDFDMVTMMRSKINDEFMFPDRIDMAPYKVEYLSDPESPVEPDVFELVGVLVHTGTAESGHYYSYTRERPSHGAASWVEFNDSDVSRFDPSTIADQCFGGDNGSINSMGAVHVNKVWNAYMLFYQRVSTMEQSKQIYQPSQVDCPVRVSVPTPLSNIITMENEIFVRSYCVLDPQFICFVRLLLSRLHTIPLQPEGSRKRRKLEFQAIDLGMETFEQLVARTKDYVGLDSIFTELYKLVGRTPESACRLLRWVCGQTTSLRNLILRAPSEEVRQKGTMLIMGAVKKLQIFISDADADEVEREIWRNQAIGAMEHIAGMLDLLWVSLQGVPRAWDDYFEYLLQISQCGLDAVGLLLGTSTLFRCLELIWLDQEDRKGLREFYSTYCRLIEKGRHYPYAKMITLCSILFDKIDLSASPFPADKDRPVTADRKFPLSVREGQFVWPVDKDGSLIFLTKLLSHEDYGRHQASRKIFAVFVASEPRPGSLDNIVKTLEAGLRLSPAELSVPFLDAALLFCKYCPKKRDIIDVVCFVAKGVDTINNSAGDEHLDFFVRLCNLTNERLLLNPEWFAALVQEKIPDFVPTLLIDKNHDVRQGTLQVLSTLLFSDPNEEMSEEMQVRCGHIARGLVQTCVDKVGRAFLQGQIKAVESRLVGPITSTVKQCLDKYSDDNEEDRTMAQTANSVLRALERITVDVPDDPVSESEGPSPEEWEATSALASDSEMGVAGSP